MANRWFNQFQKSLEKEVVNLFAVVSFGASGAPTLNTSNNSKGIASISRTAEGSFLITLQDSYYKFLCMNGVFLTSGAGPEASTIALSAVSVGTQSGGTLQMQTQNGGINTDPASGESLYLHIILGNSSAI